MVFVHSNGDIHMPLIGNMTSKKIPGDEFYAQQIHEIYEIYQDLVSGPGWRIHGSVEDTKSSTNKQHTLSLSSKSRATSLRSSRLTRAWKPGLAHRKRR